MANRKIVRWRAEAYKLNQISSISVSKWLLLLLKFNIVLDLDLSIIILLNVIFY